MSAFFKAPFVTAVMAGMIGLMAPMAAAQVPGDYWELDGDIVATAGDSKPDWANAYDGNAILEDLAGACSVVKVSELVLDPAPKSIYTTGGSKDTNDVPKWRHKDGAVPDKNDTTHGGAVTLNCGGELYLYVFGLRRSNDGDSNNGVWFPQNPVAPIFEGADAGKFSSKHADGDPLIVAGFTQGGVKANLGLFLWDAVNGELTISINPDSNEANCGSPPGDTADLCGIANTALEAILVPNAWGYTPKSGAANTAPQNSFWEVGANMTNLIGEFCATGFLSVTRSSTSPTAQLKDFLFGDFDICGIDVTIECDFDRDEAGAIINGGLNEAGDKWRYLIKGVVTSEFSPADDASVDVIPVPANGASPLNVFGPQDIPVGDTPWPGPTADDVTVYETTVNGVILKANASAVSGSGAALTADAQVSCPTGSASPNISVAKDCIACLAIDSGAVVVEVTSAYEVCNVGNVVLKNISITDNKLPSGVFNPKFAMLGVGQCVRASMPSYMPDTVDDGYADNAMFSDQLTVVYDVGLGGAIGVKDESGTATCPLCFDDTGAPFTGDTEIPLSCPDPTPPS